jgi:methylmalonyl-CoA decarboxylase
LIKYSLENRTVTVVFNRDEKRNAFNHVMSNAVLDALARAEEDQARAVILRANPGASVWCSGHDLGELDASSLNPDAARNPLFKVFDKVARTPLPVIAMVEGNVYAGGLLMLLYCDIVIAAEGTRVAMTVNKMGLPFPPEIYAYWLRVIGMHKTKELLFTAATISAEEAQLAGLFNHVVDRDRLEEFTHQMVGRVIACSPEGLANTKLQLNLIAQSSALKEDDRNAIREHSRETLRSPDLKRRIGDLLASVNRLSRRSDSPDSRGVD